MLNVARTSVASAVYPGIHISSATPHNRLPHRLLLTVKKKGGCMASPPLLTTPKTITVVANLTCLTLGTSLGFCINICHLLLFNPDQSFYNQIMTKAGQPLGKRFERAKRLSLVSSDIHWPIIIITCEFYRISPFTTL